MKHFPPLFLLTVLIQALVMPSVTAAQDPQPSFDVDGDGVIAPRDILALTDHLNAFPLEDRDPQFDLDGSGAVDEADVTALVARIQQDLAAAAGISRTADVDGNGVVNAIDILALTDHLAATAPGDRDLRFDLDYSGVVDESDVSVLADRVRSAAAQRPASNNFGSPPADPRTGGPISSISLVPETPGPYLGGSTVIVDVMFNNHEGQDIELRGMTLDFSATDPAIGLPSTFDYYFDDLVSDALYFTLINMPRVDAVYLGFSGTPGFIVVVPDGGTRLVGTLEVTLPAADGTYLLDAINPAAPDLNSGAYFAYGFDPRVNLHYLNGNLTGDPLPLVVGTPCGVDADCDDGLFCNGQEFCDNGGCVPGPAPCNDGVACTDDTCDEALDVCGAAVPNDANCDDGNLCNGIETCDGHLGCLPGTQLFCADGDPCNGTESCDPSLGCVHNLDEDCNANGIEDSCETLADLNHNGIPDVCEGSNVQLIPQTPGPYAPGSTVDVDVMFENHQGQDINLRLETLDFSATDPALGLPPMFHFYTGDLITDASYGRFETMPKVDIVYVGISPIPGYIIHIPNASSRLVGTLTVTLPAVAGEYLLDAMNTAAPDTNTGALFSFGFDPRTDLHFTNGNLYGDPLTLSVGLECSVDVDCNDGKVCTLDSCDTEGFCHYDPIPDCTVIPATSTWGLIVTALLGLAVGTFVFKRRAGSAAW